MPATLRSIKSKVTELSVYLGDPAIPEAERSPDDSFTLWFRQHAVTGQVEQLTKKAEDDGRVFESLCELCVPIFVKWDLKPGATDEQMDRLESAQLAGDSKAVAALEKEIKAATDEQPPIPITKESLMEFVPASVLVIILEAIAASRSPNTNGTEPQ